MKTQVYLKKLDNRQFRISRNPMEGATLHYAEWRVPTVRLWWEIQRNEPPWCQERKAWEILLKETSLTPVKQNDDGSVTKSSLEKIWDFVPALVPRRLVSDFLKTTVMTGEDINKMERDAYFLWAGGSSRSRSRVHPLLEKTANAMVLYEKMGLRVFGDYEELDTLTYQGILHSLNCYGKVQELNEMQRQMRTQAIERAGVGKYTSQRGGKLI